MYAPRLIAALLIAASLLILALQNAEPSLSLAFLGSTTLSLPVGVWLCGAIALGALTGLMLMEAPGLFAQSPKRAGRRQWQVRAPGTSAPAREDRPSAPRTARENVSRNPRRESPAEDWQSWEQRTPVSQWENWSGGGTETRKGSFSERQQKDRRRAQNNLEDMAGGWDSSAQETVYVKPGGSTVEDTLDEISEGWEEWGEEAGPAETAYSYRYQGEEAASRVDSVYAPPDEAAGDGTAAEDTGEADGIYDADYRVIVPPHRPMEDEEGRDRTP